MLRNLTVLTLALLTSCASQDHFGRLTTGGGFSTMKAKNGDGESLRLDGGHVGIRGEVSTASSVDENLHMGLRGELRGRDISADGLGEEGLGMADMEAGELSVSAVARYYVPVSETFRPFAEGSIGYAHNFATMSAESLANNLDFEGREDKGGLLFGAGLGAEIGARDNHAILQLDWSRRLIDEGEFDFEIDDVTLFVGWGFKF